MLDKKNACKNDLKKRKFSCDLDYISGKVQVWIFFKSFFHFFCATSVCHTCCPPGWMFGASATDIFEVSRKIAAFFRDRGTVNKEFMLVSLGYEDIFYLSPP